MRVAQLDGAFRQATAARRLAQERKKLGARHPKQFGLGGHSHFLLRSFRFYHDPTLYFEDEEKRGPRSASTDLFCMHMNNEERISKFVRDLQSPRRADLQSAVQVAQNLTCCLGRLGPSCMFVRSSSPSEFTKWRPSNVLKKYRGIKKQKSPFAKNVPEEHHEVSSASDGGASFPDGKLTFVRTL